MSKLLADEIKWINDNLDHYEGPRHAKSVIENIAKRYRIAELERSLTQLNSAIVRVKAVKSASFWTRFKWLFTGVR